MWVCMHMCALLCGHVCMMYVLIYMPWLPCRCQRTTLWRQLSVFTFSCLCLSGPLNSGCLGCIGSSFLWDFLIVFCVSFWDRVFPLTLDIGNLVWQAGQLAHGIDVSVLQPQCWVSSCVAPHLGACGLSWGPHASIAHTLSHLAILTSSTHSIMSVKYSVFIRRISSLVWPRSLPQMPVLKL